MGCGDSVVSPDTFYHAKKSNFSSADSKGKNVSDWRRNLNIVLVNCLF